MLSVRHFALSEHVQKLDIDHRCVNAIFFVLQGVPKKVGFGISDSYEFSSLLEIFDGQNRILSCGIHSWVKTKDLRGVRSFKT